MKDKVKKVMRYRYDRYEEAENKLEKLAEKGLFLEKCGNFFGHLEKGSLKS